MARIANSEHARILEMVDGEHRSVLDVAAECGCTKANIYALLSKLRRNLDPGPTVEPRMSSTSQVRGPTSIAEPGACILYTGNDRRRAGQPRSNRAWRPNG